MRRARGQRLVQDVLLSSMARMTEIQDVNA